MENIKDDSFSNISKLIKMSLVIPLSSVECERCFSRLKIIKTRLRNLLEEPNLSDLLLISLTGKEIKKSKKTENRVDFATLAICHLFSK